MRPMGPDVHAWLSIVGRHPGLETLILPGISLWGSEPFM